MLDVFLLGALIRLLTTCPCVRPSSGLPLQLDRLLSVLLSDQHHSRTLRSHLRLRPLPHQVDSHCPGMFVLCPGLRL